MILCGYEIQPGEIKQEKLHISRSQTLDLILICGKREGKTLVVTAGVHGCEYVGIEAARRLCGRIDPNVLCGNVIVLPLINAEGFLQGRKQIVPADGKNLNREFPGAKEGSSSSRTAYAIEKCIYPYADFLLDLHGGDCNESLVPLVFCPTAGLPEINDAALDAAKALSVPYRVNSTARNGLYSWAVQKQIPALLLERGAGGVWSEDEAESCVSDIVRILQHLGILEGAYKTAEQRQINQMVYEEAKEDGFWYPRVTAGGTVRKGECLGYLETYPERKRMELFAMFDGIVLYYTTALGVKAGDPLAAYGR